MTLTDKTRLELALEQRERFKTPVVMKILLIVLILALLAIGKYSHDLRNELSAAQEKHQKEKSELINKIKELEGK